MAFTCSCLAYNLHARFQAMFYGASAFNQPLSFDTSSVTGMYGMFQSAVAFNQPLSFDTSSVTSMYGMFQSALAFNQSVAAWDIGRVTNMQVRRRLGMKGPAGSRSRP